MKNFKAKEMLEEQQYACENVECDCCKQIKEFCLLMDPEEFGPAICLDCLQYTHLKERIKQLESWLYEEEEQEFEYNE